MSLNLFGLQEMIKSKATDTLKTFDKKAFRELGEFINSPFHNKNRNIRKLYTILKPFYPAFDSEKLTKEYIYSVLFPGKTYADKTIRNLLSDIQSLIESYLTYNAINSNIFFRQYFRISSALQKGLGSIAESGIKNAAKMFSEFSFDGGNVFYIMHLIEMEKDFLEISRNKLINLNMKEGEYLIYAFVTKFLIFKMKFYNYQYKVGTERLTEFIKGFERAFDLEKFISHLENSDSLHKDTVLIYYYCTRFMSDLKNDSFYHRAKALFNKNKNVFSRTENINLCLTFNGYCIAKIRSGEESYYNELFQLYADMLEGHLVMGEGEEYMHITLFNNIVSLAIMLNKHDWAKNFIEKYSVNLLPEFRETMVSFAYAQYYFGEGQFETALECIGKVNFENYYLKSGSRILQLKIYYELGYTEPFFSFYDSLKHYLAHDKQIPADKRQSDMEFISSIEKLYKAKLDMTPHNLQALEESIRREKPGPDKQWLIQKTRDLTVKGAPLL